MDQDDTNKVDRVNSIHKVLTRSNYFFLLGIK